MRIYQSADGDWIATDDAGRKVRAATEQEARQRFMAESTTTPFERWWTASQALCAVATSDIVDKTAPPERNRLTGGIDQIIAATEPGAEIIPGVTREMAEEMAALWDWFNGAAQAPLEDERAHGKPPILILSELGGV